MCELDSLHTLQDNSGGLVGHIENTYDLGQHANRIQVVDIRLFSVRVFLTENGNLFAVSRCFLDQFERRFAAYGHGHDYGGEQHHVPERKYGYHLVHLGVKKPALVAVKVSNH